MTTNNKEDDGTMAAAEQDRVEITVIVDQYRKAFDFFGKRNEKGAAGGTSHAAGRTRILRL